MTDTPVATGFEALLADIETLQKSMAPPAAEMPKKGTPKMGADGKPVMGADGQPMMEDPAEAGAKEEPFGKSLTVTMADGTEAEVIDAADILKALRLGDETLGGRADKLESALTKALTINLVLGKTVQSQGETVKQQGEILKSLQEKVDQIGSTGGGRKAVISVHEKPAPGGAKQSDGVSPEVFMGTMMKAFTAGKIGGHDVAVAENCIGRGVAVPTDIVERVAAATAT